MKADKLDETLPGFSSIDDSSNQNDTKTKKNKKSGGFQSMGLSFPIMKGITKRGYKQPTPIQRKSIPLALEGRDVVAMARTGSGKTACFVLPILERLSAPSQITHSSGKNFRALILSPTRELTLQTLRFIRELGKYTSLKAAAIVGGDSLEQHFSVLSNGTPDIVVATPGRFLHLCVEMDLQLNNIQMVVFDEADRLFELGFGEQLQEIISRLPSGRQSLLFSATLPKILVEFAKAGLNDPMLLRLDLDWKLPSGLWLGWIGVRSELRLAALLMLLDKVLTPETPQAVVFAATKHHVEYLSMILERAGIPSSYAYSGLDPAARKIALGKFTSRKVSVLLVTDVAARGLDMPELDTVINYHFPASPKLFVHRVGRSARAGRSGRAFTLLTNEDIAHMLDLHLFLGTQLKLAHQHMDAGVECESGVWGSLPTTELELRHADVVTWEKTYSDISEGVRVASNAWQQYSRCRETASSASNQRAKTLTLPTAVHPYFNTSSGEGGNSHRSDLVASIQNYRPTRGTILEICAKNDSAQYTAMKAKKKAHGATINRNRLNKVKSSDIHGVVQLEDNKRSSNNMSVMKSFRDENYIPHESSDKYSEMGLAVNFNAEASGATLDMTADDRESLRRKNNVLRWDRKRKKLVQGDPDGNRKMIRTESGARVPASFKSGRFQQWQKQNNMSHNDSDDDGDDNKSEPQRTQKSGNTRRAMEFRPRWMKHNQRVEEKRVNASDKEMKTSQQVVKERLRKEKIKARIRRKSKQKPKNRK